MSEFQTNDQTISDSFDNDFQSGSHIEGNLFKEPVHIDQAYMADHPIEGRTAYVEYQDPLKHVHNIQFQPCTIEMENKHFVNPHEVNGYTRVDGTQVDGYYRDGDGNTNIDRPAETGGGYNRSNPDV